MAPALKKLSPPALRILAALGEQLDAMAAELRRGSGELLALCLEVAHRDLVLGAVEPAAFTRRVLEFARLPRCAGPEVRRSFWFGFDGHTALTQLRDLGRVLELTQARVVEVLIEAFKAEGGPWNGKPVESPLEQMQRQLRIIGSSATPLESLAFTDGEAVSAAEHGAAPAPA